ncbi:hypothetical protein RHMOL_Rhmol06G0054200 [Rhododendron molle]|uniref:Uncharacterized protein n=2 Tax=Rhododendron molle TaxID=49168 RepID=A0ACC0N9Q2_RHOML|nr:hypothetical protein RHMOL_Rhmol06G0054200 [Rhododendron molle]KAI8549810.1 hypothetical protein RHMOL_Rhmol06G0054200 [Rhododendron molle]
MEDTYMEDVSRVGKSWHFKGSPHLPRVRDQGEVCWCCALVSTAQCTAAYHSITNTTIVEHYSIASENNYPFVRQPTDTRRVLEHNSLLQIDGFEEKDERLL